MFDARPSISIVSSQSRPLKVRSPILFLCRAAAFLFLLGSTGCWFCPDPPDIDALGYGSAGRARILDAIVDTSVLPENCVNVDSALGLGPAASIELEPYLYFIGLSIKETPDSLENHNDEFNASACLDHPDLNRYRVLKQRYALVKLLNVYECPRLSDPARDGSQFIAEFIVGYETGDNQMDVCLLHCPIKDWKKDLEPFYKMGADGKPVSDSQSFYWMRHVSFAGRFFKVSTLGSPLNRIRDEKKYINLPLFVGPLPVPGRFGAWQDLKTELEFNDRVGDFIWPVSPWPTLKDIPVVRSRVVLRAEQHPVKPGQRLYTHNGLPVSLKTTLAHPLIMKTIESPSVVIRARSPLAAETVRDDVSVALSDLGWPDNAPAVYIISEPSPTAEQGRSHQ
ncbi:MAG: hypothetical protein ABIH86_05155 [Planctomycetota bacterium]